jgi:hypothetical protein
MTRLLIGLRSGLFGFDTDGDDAPAQLFPGIQPLSVAIDPVDGEFVITLRLASGTGRGNGATKRSDPGPHGWAAGRQIVLLECDR